MFLRTSLLFQKDTLELLKWKVFLRQDCISQVGMCEKQNIDQITLTFTLASLMITDAVSSQCVLATVSEVQ